MSDRFCGEILIGGKVHRSLIPGLINAINSQECSHAWGDALVCIPFPDEFAKAANEALLSYKQFSDEERLWFCDNQARNGELDEIEGYCREHGIGYRRFSGSYAEYDPEVAEYRPGLKGADVYNANSDGDPVINARDVIILMDILADVEKYPAVLPDRAEQIVGLRKSIAKILPHKVAKLESFEIVEFAVGDSVLVPEPKTNVDSWNNGFSGTVIDHRNDTDGTLLAVIEDSDGDSFDIEACRLLSDDDGEQEREDAAETQRQDEKHGLYAGREDIAN